MSLSGDNEACVRLQDNASTEPPRHPTHTRSDLDRLSGYRPLLCQAFTNSSPFGYT